MHLSFMREKYSPVFFLFFSLYFGLKDLRKYMYIKKKMCFQLSLNFRFWYPNFEPLWNLIYLKIHIEAFSQSGRYNTYLSFSTLVIKRPKFKEYTHTALAFSSPEHIYKKLITVGNSLLWESNLIKPNLLKQIKPMFGIFTN